MPIKPFTLNPLRTLRSCPQSIAVCQLSAGKKVPKKHTFVYDGPVGKTGFPCSLPNTCEIATTQRLLVQTTVSH